MLVRGTPPYLFTPSHVASISRNSPVMAKSGHDGEEATPVAHVPRVLQLASRKPRCITFDLDYTLWPLYVDCDVTLPLKNNGKYVEDACRRRLDLFPEARAVLEGVKSAGIDLAVASRTSAKKEARELMQALGITHMFRVAEIYPGSKIPHLNNIAKTIGCELTDILFFDDEHRNIVDATSIGVTAVFLPDGITLRHFEAGVEEFAKKSRRT
eukprot:jgi/Mesvir1/23059/Mv10590-RA.1